ncbi:YLP motif-containing protein 1 isoform X2 [Gouania willdenowi]|uniref:YLP motif-containing protein 1 isoform X2 n=1 Tax=Gouania willdenowi TaxID=441366 RepID=UPI001056B822|nr:YLP motif-containing protein 1 isoform X2 [Gouania willdenowi]
MFPFWGNVGGFGGPGPRKSPGAARPGQPAGFGGFEAPPVAPAGLSFSNLQQQHMQQMQQLQMLYQKQLQSVLLHGSSGSSAGFQGSSWNNEAPGPLDGGTRPQPFAGQNEIPNQQVSGTPAPKQGFQQPPPPPSQPHPTETQPAPPPEPQIPKTQESTPPPKAPNAEANASSTTDDKSLPLQVSEELFTTVFRALHQEQQQMWYKQHRENLQKLRQERAKLNQQGDGGMGVPPSQFGQPPPPVEPQSNAPPPPPPKEEPPVPPPPPVEIKRDNVGNPTTLTETPEIPKDPEEAARLQQLQAAAAHWQQVQQQRVHQQYEALMQQHEKLQKILEQYQQVIQQPPDLQTMSAEMQLRHYQMQQHQFLPCFQDWGQSFVLWYEQFQSYPHKDQLKDYEHQWKQWQEQMDATNVHLQERVATLSAIVPFPSSQYNSGMMGQLGQYPGQDMQMQQQQQAGNMGTEQSSFPGGSVPQSAPSTGFSAQLPAAPPVQGSGPDGAGVQPLVPPVHPPSFNSVAGPRGSNPRFDQPDEQYGGPPRPDQPQQHFDGPPRYNQPPQRFDGPQRFDQPPPQRFDGPPRFDQPPQRFDGPPRFDQPQQRFDGPPRFDQPQQRFDGPPRFDQPQQRFDGPPRFDQPRQRFNGPPRFDQPRQRFDGPPRFDQPQQRFDGPQRFGQPRQHFDGPPRFDQPRFGQRQRFEMSRHPGPPTHLENLSAPYQNQPQDLQPQAVSAAQKPSMENKEESTSNQKLSGKEKKDSDNIKNKDSAEEDMTNDNLLGTSGFFVPKDPIPQTLTKSAEKPDEKLKPAKSVPASSIASKGSAEPLKTNQPQINSKPTESQTEKQNSVLLSSRQQLSMPPTGRGGGRPPVPFQNQRTGRGSVSEFAGPGTEPVGEEREEGPYGYVPPEENMGMPEEQDDSYWEEPCFEDFGGGDSEAPLEEIWMPEEHIYPEEEYYEESIGRPPFGRGRPPMMRGGPPRGRGGPAMRRGGPPMGRGGFPMFRGRPPLVRGAPMGRGGPPMGRGRPPMRRGGPSLGRGEPIDGPWEEFEPPEYSEEGDAHWRPRGPMRGMRPPFPPGRGRPPRGHPAFMHPGRGRPPHPGRGLVDEESFVYVIDDPTTDPSELPMYHEQEPHSHLMHPGFGRGRHSGPPPPPHEIINDMEELYYDEEHGPGWQSPEGRVPPPPRREIFERGGMRRMPLGRGIARGSGRPGPKPEDYEEEYKEGYIEDYNHGEDRHRWRPPLDYPLEEDRLDDRYRESEYEERVPPERDYAPRMHSPEPFRDAHWHEERERGRPYPYEEHDRERGELRIREYREDFPYPPSSDWERSPRHTPLPERGYPDDYPDSRSRFDEQREQLLLDRRSPPADTTLPMSSVEAASEEASRANVLALSQHQHEIILKAAQELKLIRELQETKTPNADPQTPTSADVLPVLPAGLLGLEIPADVRNVLKGMSAAQTSPTKAGSWENKSAHLQYQQSPSAASLSTVMQKTVDYGHGHEPGNTVERISYGERIVLRPDPMTLDRGYEKELLGSRDPYSRDPYYGRRSDPFLERREYSRERELYRDKPPEYERERYERDRHLLRERDDRSPLAMHRSAYRERDRDGQDRERSGSRDPEEQYGRPAYDRPPYERSGPERYSHSSSPYMERRSYPEDRGPSTAPSLPPPPQPPPRSEKKPEIKNIDDILKQPGRLSRPERIVIIMRGLPGSGKSHVAKLIRDKEVECGGAPPRVLVLDDYFMTEVEKTQKDPDTGKRVKTKVLEYEYEPEMEDTYRSSMLKTFKKTLDDGFFPFIILDTINDKVKHFDQFWSAAKTKGFEVYLAEISAETQTCAKRNVHGRSLKDIIKMYNNWETSPRHMVRLDVRSLLQDAAIEEVEMEDFNPDEEAKEPKKEEEEEEGDLGYIPRSKWEMDTSEAKLDRLDGLSSGGKRKRESEDTGLEDYLQLPDDYATRKSQPGQKRVRWADLEEQKEADRKRAIGFVVGQTDWERITDESGQLAQRALNRTKYF